MTLDPAAINDLPPDIPKANESRILRIIMNLFFAILELRLATFFRSLPSLPWKKHSLGSLALPSELILSITSHLSYTDQLSLSLTCKTLYHVCFPDKPETPPSKQQLEGFLLGLERDIPTVYFCFHCTKLHSWHNTMFVYRSVPCPGRRGVHLSLSPWNCPQSMHTFTDGKNFFFYYVQAQVTMNRHFLGGGHGLPVSALEINGKQYKTRYLGAVKRASFTARIIENHLMISGHMTFSSVRGDYASGLREYMDRHGQQICRHLRLGRLGFGPPRQVPEVEKRGLSKDECFLACRSSVGSCVYCMTDYCIDIERKSQNRGWLISITTYIDIGTARSPFEWEWMVLGERPKSPRWMHRDTHPAGIARSKWLRADGVVTSELEGEWVVPVPLERDA